MKGLCALVASVLTASAVAMSSSSSASSSSPMVSKGSSRSLSIEKSGGSNKAKFAPRLDGLRFIETLVTAHR